MDSLTVDTTQQFIKYIFSLSFSENSYFFYLVIVACVLSTVSLIFISKFAATFITGFSLQYDLHMAISIIGVGTIIYFLLGNLLLSFGVIPITHVKLTEFIVFLTVCLFICMLLITASRNGYMNTLDVRMFLIIYFFIFASMMFISASPNIVEDKLIFGDVYNTNPDLDYAKYQTIIPIDIKMSGPDTGLHVIMLSDNMESSKEISSLLLCPNNTSKQLNNSLVGYSKGFGCYHIDFNRTSLPTGNYKLKYENAKYKSVNSEEIIPII